MAENGSNRKVYLRSTDDSTKTVIGGEMSNSLTVNGVIIDVSDKDSDWAENIVGQKSWTLSATFNAKKDTASPQKTLFDSLVGGTPVKLFIGEVNGTTEVSGYKGSAVIESISESNEKDGVVTREISFVGSGELTPVNPA